MHQYRQQHPEQQPRVVYVPVQRQTGAGGLLGAIFIGFVTVFVVSILFSIPFAIIGEIRRAFGFLFGGL